MRSATWARQLGGTEDQLRALFDRGPVDDLAVDIAMREEVKDDPRDRSDVVMGQQNSAEIVCLRRALDGEFLP